MARWTDIPNLWKRNQQAKVSKISGKGLSIGLDDQVFYDLTGSTIRTVSSKSSSINLSDEAKGRGVEYRVVRVVSSKSQTIGLDDVVS